MLKAVVGVAALSGLAAPEVARAAEATPAAWSLRRAVDAPPALKLSGSIRGRYETIDGQARAGLPSSEDPVSVRSNLFAEYASGPVRFGGELYDSRAYGGKRGGAISTNEVNAVELVQAYVAVDLKAPFGRGSQAVVQAGRFTMNLGSRRFVAADDYRNTTNGYTGVRVDATSGAGTAATVFVTAPQVRRPEGQSSVLENRVAFDRESTDLLLWGGVASRRGPWAGSLMELTYVGLHEADTPRRPTRNRELSTLAARVVRNPKPGAWDFEVEAAYQFGAVRSGLQANASELSVSAGFLHAEAGYQFADPWKTHLVFEYDLVTGDGGGSRYGRFDTLFGMRRADLAPSGIYNAVGRANISTPGVRIEVAPSPRLDAFMTYRPMWLASRTDSFSTTGVRDASGRSGRFAGHQVDARLRYWIVPNSIRVEADAVWLSKGRFLKRAPNAPLDRADTKYLSLNTTWSF